MPGPLYGVQLWGLDPVFWVHAKLYVADVLALAQHPDLPDTFLYGNHPIVRVELLGFVVSVDVRSRLTSYHVDDGTGVVSCVVWANNDGEAPRPMELGTCVRLRGKVTSFRQVHQVTVYDMEEERDVNAEALWWLEVAHLKHTLYNQPFVPDPAALDWAEGGKRKVDWEAESLGGGVAQRRRMHEEGGDVQTTEADFTSFLAQFLSSEGLDTIEFSALSASPTLQTLAANVLSKGATDTVEGGRVAALIGRSLAALCEQGVLWLRDRDRDVYERITHDTHLAPAIKQVVKAANGNGVSRHVIVQTLKGRPELCRVPGERIMQAIQGMLDSSDLFEVARHVYRLLE